MALILQYWFKLLGVLFCFFCREKERKKKCRESSTLSALWAAERDGKKEKRMTQRQWVDWDQVRHWYSRWANFQRSVPPSCCRRLAGWRTPTIQSDTSSSSAIHSLSYREDIMEVKLEYAESRQTALHMNCCSRHSASTWTAWITLMLSGEHVLFLISKHRSIALCSHIEKQ